MTMIMIITLSITSIISVMIRAIAAAAAAVAARPTSLENLFQSFSFPIFMNSITRVT